MWNPTDTSSIFVVFKMWELVRPLLSKKGPLLWVMAKIEFKIFETITKRDQKFSRAFYFIEVLLNSDYVMNEFLFYVIFYCLKEGHF